MKFLAKNSVHSKSHIQKNILGRFFVGSKNILFKTVLLAFGLVSMLGSTHALFNGTVGLDLGFNILSPVEFNAEVRGVVIQSDGKVLIGGAFTIYSGEATSRIARFNPDGSRDTSFLGAGTNNPVYAVDIQSDGKILIGGSFVRYDGTTSNRIARLNSNGTIDTGFVIGGGFNDAVYDIKVQSDGKILVAGVFTTYSGVSAPYFIRLNSDGTRDTSFTNFTFNSYVYNIAIQGDDKIVVGGAFTLYSGVAANRIIRLNSDGTRDTSFLGVGAGNGVVYAVGIQSDDKIIIGGSFTSYNGGGIARILRLNTDGTKDTSFLSAGANAVVWSLAIQSGDKIVVGGAFTTYNSVATNRIVGLNADGTTDTNFVVGNGADGIVYALNIQGDGKIVIGGAFTQYNGLGANYFVRLNTDGSKDTSPAGYGFNSYVLTLAIQADQKILAGGDFTVYSGTIANKIVRLNSDGTRDSTFSVGNGCVGNVYAFAVQSDGKILVGGDCTNYDGVTANRIFRLNSDGTRDTSFLGAGANGTVYDIKIQSDGKILVAGNFTTYSGASSPYLLRLNTDGTKDTSFVPGTFNAFVYSVDIQSDGKIVAGGNFTTHNTITTNRLIRLTSTGARDTSFSIGAGLSAYPQKIIVQEDQKILIGGTFGTYSGTTVNRIVRLNSDGTRDTSFVGGTAFNGSTRGIIIQSDGKMIVGGAYTSYNGVLRNRIVRINTDGSPDISFSIGGGFNEQIYALAAQANGRILVGGNFTQYDGALAGFISSLYVLQPPTLLSPLSGDVDQSTSKDFLRSPSADSGVLGYIYQVSTDSGFSTFIASGTTTQTGISLTGLTEGLYYRRVAAYDSAGNTGLRSDIRNFSVDLPSTLIFTGSTPVDNAWINSSSFTAQLDITENFLTQFSRSRNGTQYPMYDSGLVLMMNFDKVAALGETDIIVKDFSSLGVNGTGYLGVTWTGGKYGGAYQIGSNVQYVGTPTRVLGASATIIARAKTSTTTPNMLWNHPTNASTSYFDLYFTAGKIYFNAGDGTTNPFKLGAVDVVQPSLNEWHQYVTVADAINNKMYLYIDGSLVGSANYKNPTSTAARVFSVGGPNTTYRRSGYVDEPRIYNRALSADEISVLYNSNLNKYDTNKWNFTIFQTGMVPGGNYGYSGIVTDFVNITSTGRTIGYAAPITAPVLVSPVSGSIITVSGSNFVWNPSPESSVSGYIYQISVNSGFTIFFASGTTVNTGIFLTGLVDGTYYRRVAAYSNVGYIGDRSSGWNFIVDVPPVLYRTGSTPTNNAWINSSSFAAQLDIIETNFTQFSRSRSGTEYSMYDSGLVLMMNFDKVAALGETDIIIKDLSSLGIDGTGYAVVWTGGKYGGAYDFDGLSHYIGTPTRALGASATIIARAKTSTTSADMMWNHPSNASTSHLDLYFNGNKIYLNIGDGTTNPFKSGGVDILQPSLDERHNYTTVFNSSDNKAYLYIDGMLAGEAIYRDPTSTTARVFSIGGPVSYRRTGSIDEVRIYNRVLSADEISSLYNSNLNKYDTDKWNFTVTQTGVYPGVMYTYTGSVSDLVSTTSTGRSVGYDAIGPIFTFADDTGPECVSGTLSITNASDGGIGLHSTPYSFDGTSRNTLGDLLVSAQQPGIQIKTGRVRDQFQNSTFHTATYTFTDVAPTANNFIGHANVANTSPTVNRKTLSSASEGSCGTSDIVYDSIFSQGTKGTCSVVGNTITYTPNVGQEGDDACTITIKDNENTSTNIIIYRQNIDTNGPSSPILLSPTHGSSSTTGSIDLLRSGSVDAGVGLSGYIWQLSTGSNFATLMSGGSTTTTGVSLSGLAMTTYYRRVYAVDNLGNTGSRSTGRSFTIAPAITFAIESPASLDLGSLATPEETQIVEKIFTGSENYFVLSDYVGDDAGYYTTLSMTNMTNGNGALLSNQNIAIKTATNIVTIAGSSNPNVVSAITGSYRTFGNDVLTFIKRDPGSNGGLMGTYGVSPALKVTIPQLQNSGNYSGTLIYTIYPN